MQNHQSSETAIFSPTMSENHEGPVLHVAGYLTIRGTNFLLRGVTLACKFILVFFLARFLQPAELGLYGLIAATIGYGLYLIGFDFYSFSARELIKRDVGEQGAIVKNQFVATILLYVVFLPLLTLIFVAGFLPWKYAPWFFALLVLEHAAQEMSRLLVALSMPVQASAVMFLRAGGWAIVAAGIMFFESATRNIEFVLAGWIMGGLSAVLVGFSCLRRKKMGGWDAKVDWSWIRRGFRVAALFLFATLALRALFVLDRYWMEALVGLDGLGAYVLYMAIAAALPSFMDAGLFAFAYPAMVKANHEGDRSAMNRHVHRLAVETMLCAIAFVVIMELSLDILLGWIDRPVYAQYRQLLPMTMAAMVLYCMGLVPHYALYAQTHDRHIVASHVFALLIFVPVTFAISLAWPFFAVPAGLCVSFFAVLIWKSIALFRVNAKFRRVYEL